MGALLRLVKNRHAASRLMHPAAALQHMRKNQYEEALFRCEDDRYELDMVIESNASAIRHLRPLCEEIMKMSPEEKNNYRIPDRGLTPLHFRCIQKIYGEPPLAALGCIGSSSLKQCWLCREVIHISLSSVDHGLMSRAWLWKWQGVY